MKMRDHMKMPAKSKIIAADYISQCDRLAIKIMGERACSLAEAWLILLDGPAYHSGSASRLDEQSAGSQGSAGIS